MSRHRQARASRCTESTRSPRSTRLSCASWVETQARKYPGTGKARIPTQSTTPFHMRKKNGEAPRACTWYIFSTVSVASAKLRDFLAKPFPTTARSSGFRVRVRLSSRLPTQSVTGHCRIVDARRSAEGEGEQEMEPCRRRHNHRPARLGSAPPAFPVATHTSC